MNKIMENNEQFEETQDSSSEDVKDETGQEETKDWRAEALKYKAIAERKDKKLQKPKEEIKETNTEQGGPTIEHSFLFSQGVTLEEMPEIEKAAKILGVSVAEAYKDDMVQSKLERMRHEQQVKKNTLPPSNGSAPAPREKTVSNMTDEEHREFAMSKLKNVVKN